MLRGKHELFSNSRKPDFAIRGTLLEKSKLVLTGQLICSLVRGLLVEGDGDVDQIVADAVIGTSLIARSRMWPVERGEAIDHVKEPSARFWRRESESLYGCGSDRSR